MNALDGEYDVEGKIMIKKNTKIGPVSPPPDSPRVGPVSPPPESKAMLFMKTEKPDEKD